MAELKELIVALSKESGKTKEEINALVQEKIDKFEGLITKEGAFYMIEKDLGVKRNFQNAKIGELEEGMKGVGIKGTVESVFPTKVFEKGEKKGKLQSIIIGDESGEIRLTLWNDQVDKYSLERGDKISIDNIIVSSYNEKKQITLGFNGNIGVEKVEQKFEELGSLKGNIKSINVIGRLMRKFPVKEFNKEDRTGKYLNFQLGDESAVIRATAWNEKAELLEEFEEGQVLEIKNAYTKDGLRGVELNLGYSASVNESKKEIANIKEIMKEKIDKKNINELAQGQNVVIEGKISEIWKGNLHYLVCSKCGKKITKAEGGMYCEQCGEVKPGINAIISVTIEDDTGRMRANFFGKEGLQLMGFNKEELQKELKMKTAEMIIAELNEKIVGKTIELIGYVKENSFSGENELSTKEIIKIE